MKPTNHELGQYFTTDITLKSKVLEFIKNAPETILEPSIGQGDLVQYISSRLETNFDMYEIDTSIEILAGVQRNAINYGDFMSKSIEKKYKTIVGNPPYVRTKTGNMYIEFTKKCYDLLEDNGELIFIVPSDFFKLTSASKLLNFMMEHGTFTDIYHPHNENLFTNASIDVIVYRYCKNPEMAKQVLYNDKLLYVINSNGLITFEEFAHEERQKFSDVFDIYVGIVSGKDAVYKHDTLGNISILNGIDKIEKYICITEFPCDDAQINAHLLQHKECLISRKIRKFNEKNWFEWGALRNVQSIRNSENEDCIYIHNLTRKPNVCFVGKVMLFGGGLIMLKPKKKCDLNRVAEYINTSEFKQNFIFSGRFKIGHRQISNSRLPLGF